MPELGESVHEGTVSRWLKQVGDPVKIDEPVVEIMTDKVNTELPSPATGILVKILINEGDPVEVFKAMGLIEENTELAREQIAAPGPTLTEAPKPPSNVPTPPEVLVRQGTSERRFFTPVVRAIAKENGLTEDDLEQITGTGQGGRVTKRDLEQFLAGRASAAPTPAQSAAPSPAASPASSPTASLKPSPASPSPASPSLTPAASVAPSVAGPEQELVKLVGMRKMIAEAMVRSAQVPVVSTLIDVDVTRLVQFRELNKEAFVQQHGVKLTYTPFFIKALAETLLEFEMLNSSLQPDNQILINRAVHLGVAVSLGADGKGGLIVPAIRDVHKKDLVQIARDLEEIAKKARNNQLAVADVQGATFTLTNPGSYGAVLGTPMISAPQAGILGTYGIVKKAVVIDDMIAIRSIMNVVLTYDHRLVDGLTAGRFLQAFKQRVEGFAFFR